MYKVINNDYLDFKPVFSKDQYDLLNNYLVYCDKLTEKEREIFFNIVKNSSIVIYRTKETLSKEELNKLTNELKNE